MDASLNSLNVGLYVYKHFVDTLALGYISPVKNRKNFGFLNKVSLKVFMLLRC